MEMKETKIETVGIIGAGTMGSRIAFRCAISGLKVLLCDAASRALEQSRRAHSAWLEERITDGRLSNSAALRVAGRVQECTSISECVVPVDLVIETVPERLEIKREVFAEIERFARASTLVATNSSSIPCARLLDSTARSERIFNINFSDPSDDEDKLVELMPGTDTTEHVMQAAEGFVRTLGMVPVVTKKPIMGFSFNRIWRSIKREALHLVGDGYSDFQDIDRAWMLEFHTPWGPFGLMDKVGLDVIYDIELRYYAESGFEADRPPDMLKEMVDKGFLGVKSGRGFYAYPDPAYTKADWLFGGRSSISNTSSH
jgi:3-hydroxybutyryl-CoA dehydrogenase